MEEYLIHHGIKGQKWGIRRYQNADGSYTKAGMQRYSQSKDAYEQASQLVSAVKAARKSGAATRSNVRTAKRAQSAAKKELDKSYKNLKKDYRADQGAHILEKGGTYQSIKRKELKRLYASQTMSAGGIALTVFGQTPVSKIAGVSLLASGEAFTAYAVGKAAHDARRLDAFRDRYRSGE